MSSSHSILWRPLLLLPSIFPNIKDFSNESAVQVRRSKYWSFSFIISPSNKYSGLISLKIDWFYLLAVPRDFQESSPAPQFEGIIFLAFCLLSGPALTTVCDHWEDYRLDYMDLCQQSILINLFSWLSLPARSWAPWLLSVLFPAVSSESNRDLIHLQPCSVLHQWEIHWLHFPRPWHWPLGESVSCLNCESGCVSLSSGPFFDPIHISQQFPYMLPLKLAFSFLCFTFFYGFQ